MCLNPFTVTLFFCKWSLNLSSKFWKKKILKWKKKLEELSETQVKLMLSPWVFGKPKLNSCCAKVAPKLHKKKKFTEKVIYMMIFYDDMTGPGCSASWSSHQERGSAFHCLVIQWKGTGVGCDLKLHLVCNQVSK